MEFVMKRVIAVVLAAVLVGPLMAEDAPQGKTIVSPFMDFEKDLITDNAITYKVRKGDTLSSITRKFYGDDNGWYFPLILLGSGTTIREPDYILPKMELQIPDLQLNLKDEAAQENLKQFMLAVAEIYNKRNRLSIREGLIKQAFSITSPPDTPLPDTSLSDTPLPDTPQD
jgi:hypothetical protein